MGQTDGRHQRDGRTCVTDGWLVGWLVGRLDGPSDGRACVMD